MEANGISNCLVLSLLIVFTLQLEILVTTQYQFCNYIYIILHSRSGLNTLFSHYLFRVCLYGGGGPHIGEVKCGGSPHLSCKRDQIKMRDYNVWRGRLLHQSGLPRPRRLRS